MNNYDRNLVKKLEDEIYKLQDTLILQTDIINKNLEHIEKIKNKLIEIKENTFTNNIIFNSCDNFNNKDWIIKYMEFTNNESKTLESLSGKYTDFSQLCLEFQGLVPHLLRIKEEEFEKLANILNLERIIKNG